MNFITHINDGYTVNAASYALFVHGHKIDVHVDGTVFASLDVRCAAPKTNEAGDGFLPDGEPSIPTLTAVDETPGQAVFVWENTSALWKKEYRLVCSYTQFAFYVKLIGEGAVDGIRYFSGDMENRTVQGSDYEFSEGFTPCISWYDNENYYFKSGVDCHRWSVLMVPPMFCYAFRCEGLTRRLGLGLVAERGEHNFHAFDYRVTRPTFRSGFWLETDQAGHTVVKGEWTAPYIIGMTGDDEWDVLRQYRDRYFTSGIAKAKAQTLPPRFWQGPMLCGWIEQTSIGVEEHINPTELAKEAVYESLMAKCKEMDLHPTALIIDDKWQSHYATDIANPDKFPDMRAFVDRRHAEGVHTMLWFKLWDPDGWDEALCVTTDRGERRIDPSTPQFRANLRDAIHRILSSDDGCYDCDGFKLDFAFFNPIGRKVKTHSGKYGVELLYEMQAEIYAIAKEIKPYALVNCSPCHPYFAHICDQARLHDYEGKNRNNREDLTMRGRLFSMAMPGVLLDTDNAGFNSHRDVMRWMLNQCAVGVPDLYALRGTDGCDLTDADFAAIAEVWRAYSARVDAVYRASGADV